MSPIRAQMLTQGISTSELCRQARVSVARFHRIERGDEHGSLIVPTYRLCRVLCGEGTDLMAATITYARTLQNRLDEDPRPDIEHDSVRWERVLSVLYQSEGVDPDGLLPVLHAMRCEGARLTPEYRLKTGDCDPLVWMYLKPRAMEHRDTLVTVLRGLQITARREG